MEAEARMTTWHVAVPSENESDNVQSQDVSEGCSFSLFMTFLQSVWCIKAYSFNNESTSQTLIKTIIDIKLTLSFLLCVFVRSSVAAQGSESCVDGAHAQ